MTHTEIASLANQSLATAMTKLSDVIRPNGSLSCLIRGYVHDAMEPLVDVCYKQADELAALKSPQPMNDSITVDNVAALRQKLNQAILEAIQDFESQTDMLVTDLRFDHVKAVGLSPRTVSVNTTVQLP